MAASSRCSDCETPIPEDAPLGLCPRCLIREGWSDVDPDPDSRPESEGAAGEGVGSVVGHYTLLEQIGEGGFGVVYLAEQHEPLTREVAVKIIKQGMDTRQVIARFEAERQALALMDHPNIARVHDAGATAAGRPYFVMELVRGVPLVRFCDEHRLDARQRLELFMEVCSAVQHAHQKGIIHRDLKPSNILVGGEADGPIAKVIDFGIAKATGQTLTDKTLFTRFDQFIGTPQYISPEQAERSAVDIDTRSDIYSLGAILYELLSGKPLRDCSELGAAGPDEMRRLIREAEAPKPSTRLTTASAEEARRIAEARRTDPRKLGLFLRGDLDWIVLKAIEADRGRRYDTANALRLDIGRFLANEPVSAAAPSPLYRFRKFARRRRGPLAAGTAVLLAILAGSVVSIQQGIRATREARRKGEALAMAEAERNHAENSLYRLAILQAHNDLKEDRVSAVRAMLDEHVPGPGETDRRSWEWYYLDSLMQQASVTLEAHQGELWSVAWSPDGRVFASAGENGTVVVRDTETREVLQVLEGHRGPVRAVAWSPDDPKLLASGGADQTVVVWDLDQGAPKWTLAGHEGRVNTLAWHPDGTLLASGGADGNIVLSDMTTGRRVGAGNFHRAVHSLSWLPDPATVDPAGGAASGSDGILCAGAQSEGSPSGALTLLSYRTSGELRLLEQPPAPRGWVSSVDWSPDGGTLAGFSITTLFFRDGILNADPGPQYTAHRSGAGIVKWHPTDRLIATAGADQMIKIWDPERSEPLYKLRGHQGPVTGMTWHPAGRALLSCSKDGTIKLWDFRQGEEGAVLRQFTNWIGEVSWNPDGSELAVANWQNRVRIVDPLNGKVRRVLVGHTGKVPSVDWSPDGRKIATAGYDARARIWDAATGEVLAVLEHRQSQDKVSWSHDGTQLAVRSWAWNGQFDGDPFKLTIWSLGEDGPPASRVLLDPRGDGSYLRTGPHAWHPHRPWLATGTLEGELLLWNARTGDLLQRLTGVIPVRASAMAWNSFGDHLVVGGEAGHLITLGFRDGLLQAPSFTRTVFTGGFTNVTWSMDGTRLAGSSTDGAIKIIDPLTGDRLLDLLDPHQDGNPPEVPAIAWSPDGRRLVTGSYDSCVRVWDASRGYGEPPDLAALLLDPPRVPRQVVATNRQRAMQALASGNWEGAQDYFWHRAQGQIKSETLRDRGWEALRVGPILALAASRERYDAYCDKLLEFIKSDPDPVLLERISRICLFLPPTERSRAEALKHRLESATPSEAWAGPWLLQAKALAAYRCKDLPAARKWLEEIERPTGQAAGALDLMLLLLDALVAHRLGESVPAAAMLERAQSKIQQVRRANPVGGMGTWQDTLACELLLREANGLIEAPGGPPAE